MARNGDEKETKVELFHLISICKERYESAVLSWSRKHNDSFLLEEILARLQQEAGTT